MQDRTPLYPGRVKLVSVAGQENTYDMVRADEATQAGTALNKANLLTDAVAALFGLDSAAVPNDVFAWLGDYAANAPKVSVGSYTGTGKYGSSNPNSLTFDFAPKFVFVVQVKTEGNSGAYGTHMKLLNPLTAAVVDSIYAGIPGSKTVVTWNNTGVTWYSTESALAQANTSGYAYQWIAIG